MALPRVAVVTGANKGIGLAIVRSLALTYPTSYLALSSSKPQGRTESAPSSSSPPPSSTPPSSPPPPPLIIYLTSRDASRGQSALSHLLNGDEKLRDSKVLRRDGGSVEIRYRRLDVGEVDSVAEFVEWFGERHGNRANEGEGRRGGLEGKEGASGLSVLVNNAGVWEGDSFDPTTTQRTLHTNYHAPLSLSLRLLPHLRLSSSSNFNPRIVNISSLTSKLRAPKFSSDVIRAFRAAIAHRSVADVTALMRGFEEGVGVACGGVGEAGGVGQAGDHEGNGGNGGNGGIGVIGNKERNEKIKAEITKQGWPPSPYAVSKAGLTAVSMILGREELRLSSTPPRTSPRTRRSSSSSPSSSSSTSKSPPTSPTIKKTLPILINAVCPGYVKTDMTLQKGRKTVEQGAELPVRLALEGIGGVGGEFWERGGVGVWDDGGDVE